MYDDSLTYAIGWSLCVRLDFLIPRCKLLKVNIIIIIINPRQASSQQPLTQGAQTMQWGFARTGAGGQSATALPTGISRSFMSF
jgi:hypothetical protein